MSNRNLNFPLALWSVVKLPLQILFLGGSVLLLVLLTTKIFSGLGLSGVLNGLADKSSLFTLILGLIALLVGIGFAALLWWLSERFFTLISSGKLTPEQASSLKDLPMGLPEGSVRAILALIVAVLGIPILMFSGSTSLKPEIAGYLNGIITGVFGFYFGTRTGGATGQALNQVVDAQTRTKEAEKQRDAAQADAAASQVTAAGETRKGQFSTTLEKLNRHLTLASTVLDVIAPHLPPNLLPEGLRDTVDKAKIAVSAVVGITGETATDDHVKLLQEATNALIGNKQEGSSWLGGLLQKATPMLSGLEIAGAGLGPLAGLGILLSLGVKLGVAQYQRWRARVLAAPIATGLIEFGTVTPEEVRSVLQEAPIFRAVFTTQKDQPGFDLDLADAVLRDNALDRLWDRYGNDTPPKLGLFQSRQQLADGLNQFRQILLANRSVSDIPENVPSQIANVLNQSAIPELRVPSSITPAVINQLISNATQASASESQPEDAQAAFDALITLVHHARQDGIDLPVVLSELK